MIPNFIYIGTSKAGSTWLYDLLYRHPEVFITPVKGLHFFNHHFAAGWPWYYEHFAEARSEKVVGEISHSYLYSETACARIAEMNPNIKLMVCLREPVDRAVSMYLDGIRNNKWTGSFEERCEDTPEILDEGFYTAPLQHYLDQFDREQIHITFFENLKADPRAFAGEIFSALNIVPQDLGPRQLLKVQPAGIARSRAVVRLAKEISQMCRRLRLTKLRGRVKRSRFVRSLLFRPLSEAEKAQISPDLRSDLKERFRPDVERLDDLIGTRVSQRWGYSVDSKLQKSA